MNNVQDSALAALTRFVEDEEKRLGITKAPSFTPRDYVPCAFCGGGSECLGFGGCMACFSARQKKKKELDEEYKRQFPDGPKPFFTAKLDDPEQVEQAKRVIGREALEKAFGPGGGGIEEITQKAAEEMAKRAGGVPPIVPGADPEAEHDGKTYDAALDKPRLNKQLQAVHEFMQPGQWVTLFEISAAVNAPEQSVSARLRDLRKEKFGSHTVERRRRPGQEDRGVWEYRLVAAAADAK